MIKKLILLFCFTATLNSYDYEKEMQMQMVKVKDIVQEANKVEKAIAQYKNAELTLENVAKAIIELGIINPDTVFLQTIKESGWINKTHYKSRLANQYNNLFGMRKPSKRYSTCLDRTYKGYATYSHWIYSVIDYLYWQQSNKLKSGESYKEYLIRRGYARNTKGYVKQFNFILPDSIKTIFNQI